MVVDVNECAENMDDCAQLCIDTDGSYVCSCVSGYLLTNDSRGCDGMPHKLVVVQLMSVTLVCHMQEQPMQ